MNALKSRHVPSLAVPPSLLSASRASWDRMISLIATLSRSTMLAGVPAARLFDETLKLFLTGHGERSLEVLRQRQLLEVLFPAVEHYLAAHPGGLVEQLLRQGLRNTDARVAADKPVTPTFLFALLLYGPIAQAIESLPSQRWHEIGAIVEACERTLRAAAARVTIPRRVTLGVRELYALQPRLEQPRGKRALRLLEQPRFRAAFDLLDLRAQFGLASAQMAAWWTRLQEAAPAERLALIDSLAKPRRSLPTSAGAAGNAEHGQSLNANGDEEGGATDAGDEVAGETAAPGVRRRRRRRRYRGSA